MKWHLLVHCPPLLPQMIQETASGCRDTMGSSLFDAHQLQWRGPYTDMMCLTKAADDDQGSNKTGKEEK